MEQWQCECGCYDILETTSDVTLFRFLTVDENEDLTIFKEDGVSNGQTWYECGECNKKLPGNNLQELEEYLENWKPEGEKK